jgi:hypothetical protein
MNEAEAKRLMAEQKIDNYAVDPKTGQVTVKRDMDAQQPLPNWPSMGTGKSK